MLMLDQQRGTTQGRHGTHAIRTKHGTAPIINALPQRAGHGHVAHVPQRGRQTNLITQGSLNAQLVSQSLSIECDRGDQTATCLQPQLKEMPQFDQILRIVRIKSAMRERFREQISHKVTILSLPRSEWCGTLAPPAENWSNTGLLANWQPQRRAIPVERMRDLATRGREQCLRFKTRA